MCVCARLDVRAYNLSPFTHRDQPGPAMLEFTRQQVQVSLECELRNTIPPPRVDGGPGVSVIVKLIYICERIT